jgi:hypothetical protein
MSKTGLPLYLPSATKRRRFALYRVVWVVFALLLLKTIHLLATAPESDEITIGTITIKNATTQDLDALMDLDSNYTKALSDTSDDHTKTFVSKGVEALVQANELSLKHLLLLKDWSNLVNDERSAKFITERVHWQVHMLKNVPAYEQVASQFQGKGIVFTSYHKVFNLTVTGIQFIRESGCTLPVEIWQCNGELLPGDLNRVKELENVTVEDLCSSGDRYHIPVAPVAANQRNFHVKTAAIVNSRFQEVLYLDSDNLPIRNPEYLFQDPHYIKTGSLFWPDFWGQNHRNSLWDVLDIQGKQEFGAYEQEAGQLLINKAFKVSVPPKSGSMNFTRGSTWHALHLSAYMLQKHDFYYDHMYGDKDSYNWAWKAVDAPYFMVDTYLAEAGYMKDSNFFCGHTMVQYEPSTSSPNGKSRPLFLHINLFKWVPDEHKKPGLAFTHLRHFGNPKIRRTTKFEATIREGLCVDLLGRDVVTESFSSAISDTFESLYLKRIGKM